MQRIFAGILCFWPVFIAATPMYQLTTVNDKLVQGHIENLQFTSETIGAENCRVRFENFSQTIHIDINRQSMEANFTVSPGAEITATARDLFNQLAIIIATEIGRQSLAADCLVRQASLFGAHPLTRIQLSKVTGFQLTGWQTLCTGPGNTTRAFTWDVGSTVERRVLPYGPSQSWCAARCGLGCYAIGTSAWTQDCGNHDYCEEFSSTSHCANEFAAATDDFTFAPNCNY